MAKIEKSRLSGILGKLKQFKYKMIQKAEIRPIYAQLYYLMSEQEIFYILCIFLKFDKFVENLTIFSKF